MSLGDAANDRQTETGSASVGVGLPVRLEHVRKLGGRDPDARVLDLDLQLRPRRNQPRDDSQAVRSRRDAVASIMTTRDEIARLTQELARVRDELAKREGDLTRVRQEAEKLRADLERLKQIDLQLEKRK